MPQRGQKSKQYLEDGSKCILFFNPLNILTDLEGPKRIMQFWESLEAKN